MTKKTFKSIPRTSRQLAPEEIEQFVNDGPGRDVQTGNTETQKTVKDETQLSVKTEPTARLTVDLPQSVHRRFKAVCGLAGIKMNEEIRQFIERRTAELEADEHG
jgi:hypothetical protein